MNRFCYRVIFSKSLGRLVVVSEKTGSQGKSDNPSVGGSTTSSGWSLGFGLKTLSLSLLLSLGLTAHANTPTTIIADKSADKALQPIVLNTASGVVSVNIATPNARGLSNNHYSQFDVGSTGAVLNNNRKAVGTQIAGFVAANPYMARGEASTILNQVNSNNPSHLNGFIEVAGKKADVIIANPSGLVVNGAGFINAGNVHLAAANSQVNQGQVTGYEVGAGHIAAHGKLNLQGTDYAALIAKTAQINDEIYAGKQLDVILGENSVSLQDGDLTQLTATHKNNGSSSTNQTGTAPTLALDISSLGGMYAGKIHLIGTDKGFGVNNQGVITATGSGQQLGAGTLTLDSQGNLINTGKILAKDAITINTHDNTTQNDGTLLSEQADVAINTASLNNTGIIHSTQTAKIAAKQAIENLGSVYGGVLQVNTDKLNNTGQLIQTGTGKLDITTDTLINTDKAVIGQSLYGQTTVPTPSTPSSDQSAGSISSELADNTAGSTGNVGTGLQPPALSDSGANTQTKPVPTARGHITATSSIHNTGSQALITATGDIGISANQTSNTKQASIDVQSLNTNTLANTDSKIALDDINWQLTRFDNSQGSITARDGMVIDSGSDMINTGGQLSATDAVALSAVGVLDNTQGVIVSGGDTAISADGVNNQAGAIMSTGNVSIASKDKLTNDKGVISAQANTTLSVGTALSNHDGNIFGNQHLTIHSQDLTNSGQVYGGKSTTLTALRTLDNTQTGLIASGGDTTIRAHTITHAGSIIAGMDREGKLGQPANLSIQSTGNLVSTGTHIATQAMVMTGNMLDLSDSHSEAVNINLNSQTDVNTTNATAIAADTLHISTPGQLNNTQGQLSAKQLVIDGSQLINHQGNINHSGTQALTLSFNQGLDNRQGNISSNSQVFDINTGAAALNNQQGSITHTGSTLTVSTQHLGNHQGKLLSTGNQSLTVATGINNSQGIIQADALAIAAQSINNHQGKLLSTANQSLSTQEDINNHQGIIQASGFTMDAKALNNHQGSVFATDETAQSRITLTGNLSNSNSNSNGNGKSNVDANTDTQTATIATLGALSISANALDNTGQISTKALTVDANTVNNSGSISSEEATSMHAKDVLNNRATGGLYAGTDLTLNSQGHLSHHGKALVGNRFSATAATLDLTDSHNEAGSISYNSQGDIIHHNATSLAAQNIRINNTQGVLSNQAGNLTAKTVDIHTESLQNGGVITAKELTISQTKDYTHTSNDTLTADTLTFTTQGSFSNQHSFGATDSLMLTADSIHNHQDATITSSNTTLHSQTNITNQGLINGDTTIVKAANTINNLAGGRIYGTQLAIQADTLNNTPAKAANQQTNQENDHHTSPVIAARQRLDIGVNTLNNNPNPDRAGKFNEDFDNQALITSLGSLHIGGSLDDNHHATGKAQTVVNKGATIESAGQMQVSTKTLLNTNADFKKHTVEVVAESARNQTLYRNREQSGAAPAIQKSTNTADLGNKPMAGLFDCPEGSECIVNYDYDSTIWSYFKIDAPKQPVPDIKAKDLLDEPELPKNETAESCALAEASNQACTQYNEALANYTKVMGPLLKWEEDNAAAIEALELAIREYNRQFTTNKSDVDLALNIYTTDEAYLGPTSRKGAPTGALYVKQANGSYQRVGEEIDEITVDFVVYEDKTLASDPARMVAGQNLVIHGDTLINDKSQMNAGAGFAVIGDTVIQTPDNGLYGEKTKVTENGRYVSRTVEPSGLGGRRHKRVDIGSGAFTQSFAPLATYELPILNATINKTPSVMTIDQSALAGGDVETVLAALKANQAALSLDAKQRLSKLLADKEQGQAVDEAILSELTKALSQSVDAKPASVISANLSQLTIPSSALYIINADDPNLPLVQTDPAFTNYKQWLSSDYMLKALQSDPNHIHKRLSDGYGEQQRIKDQYYLLTGRHINTDYRSNEEAYKTLMDNGITAAKAFGYTLGTALTAEQMANLTTDIVWLVKQSITYTTKDKDGNTISKTEEVLVPKLYLRSANIATGTLTPDGRYSAMSAKNMDLQLTGNLDNNGNLVAHNAVNIAANTITNTNRIQGEFVAITAAKDINNLGGTLAANAAMTLSAGNNITSQSQTTTHHNKQGQSASSNTAITRIATIHVGDGLKDQTDDNGNPLTTLSVQAGNYVLNQGSNIHSGGNTQITAQNGINITALTTSNHISAVADPNNYFNYSQSTDVGSTITSAGNLTIATTGKGAGITATAANLQSGGTTTIAATGDVRFNEGRQTQSMQSAVSYQEDKWYGGKDIKQIHEYSTDTAVLNAIAGNKVHISSQNANVSLYGTNITANEQASISAKQGDVTIESVKDSIYQNTIQTTQNFYKNTGSVDGVYQETLNQTGIHAGSINIDGKSASVNAVKLQATDGPLIIGNAHLATSPDGTLKLDDNGKPIVISGDMEHLTLGTVDLHSEAWREDSKSYRGFAKDIMKGVGVVTGALGFDGITLAKSHRDHTKTETQTVSELNSNHIQVGAQTVTASGTHFDAGTDGFVAVLGDDVLLTTAKHSQTNTQTDTRQTIAGEGMKFGKDHLQLGAVVYTDTTDTQATQTTTHDGVSIRGNSAAVLGNMSSGSLTTQATLFDLDKDDGTLLVGAKNTLLDGTINQVAHTQNNETDTTRIGATVHHAAVDTAVAAENVKEAIQSANHARKALENAQNEVAAGRLAADAIKDYEANLAIALANVANAQIALGATAATAAATAPTLGFSAKLGATHTQSQSSQTQTNQEFVATHITAANATLLGDTFTAKGLQGAIGKLNIDNLNKLTLTHGTTTNTTQSQSSTNTIDASISSTGSVSAGAGRQQSQSHSNTTTAHDTKLVLGEFNGYAEQTTLHGATIIADGGHYSTDVLNVTTSQNHQTQRGGSKGGNIGVGTSSLSLGYNEQKSQSDITTNNAPSGILYVTTGTAGSAHSLTANHTTVTGGIIAAISQDEQGSQTNSPVNFTTNTLTTQDLLATEYSQNKGFGINVGLTRKQGDTKASSIGLSANNSGHDKQTLTLATIGQGATVTDSIIHNNQTQSTTDISQTGINTDALNTQKVIKDQKTGGLDVNTTIDTRVFTTTGRQEIKKEQEELDENTKANFGIFGVAMGATAAGLLDDNENSDRSRFQKIKDNLTQARNNVVTGADKSQASLNAHVDAITDGDLTDALQNQDILNELNAQLTQGTHADGSSVYLTQGTVNDQGQEVKGQANVDKGHTYLNIDYIDTTVETLNHEIAHHNGLGEASATAMGKISDFAYNIGTSLNKEDINTHRQTITPTAQTLQSLSIEEQLAIHEANQALLDTNEIQRKEEVESGDEVWDQPGVTQNVGKTRQKECRQAGVSSSDCSAYIWARSVSRAKNIASLLVPTSPGEVAFLVATAGGGYVLKVAGKAGVKVIRSFKGKDELNKAVAEAKRIENNVYRDGSQFESNIVNGKPIANLRMEYVNEVQSISSHTQRMLSQGKTEEEVAVWAINKRNELKVKYRGNTPPEKLREIELRNIEKYGNALGPTAHYLRQKGKTWKEIIDSASKADGSDLDFAPKGFNR